MQLKRRYKKNYDTLRPMMIHRLRELSWVFSEGDVLVHTQEWKARGRMRGDYTCSNLIYFLTKKICTVTLYYTVPLKQVIS